MFGETPSFTCRYTDLASCLFCDGRYDISISDKSHARWQDIRLSCNVHINLCMCKQKVIRAL